MKWQTLINDTFIRISEELERVLDGLSVDELNRRPDGGNSIGWLTWHLTRSHDRNLSELAGREQIWIRDGWYARFNCNPDPGETGVGHSADEAAAFSSPEAGVILKYHRSVVGLASEYIEESLSEMELEREATSPTLKSTFPVERRLVGIISEGLQHVGQAAYVRGLIKGQGWLGR